MSIEARIRIKDLVHLHKQGYITTIHDGKFIGIAKEDK